jgi:queuine/archaeosine tRNA-ribosyltransferase
MFNITATDGLARCGTLLTRHAQLATPAPLIYTRRGGALFLTPDLLARLRSAAGSADGGSGTHASSSSPTNNALMLGLVTTQFLDQPAPELLEAIATATARRRRRSSRRKKGAAATSDDDASTTTTTSAVGGAGVAWAGLHGWPAFALNRDPLAFEYGPPAGARPSTNTGPHVAVSSGHTLADLKAWRAAVRALAADCFVGLADELPGSGLGEAEADPSSVLGSPQVDLDAVARLVDEAQARAAKEIKGRRALAAAEAAEAEAEGRAAPGRPPRLPLTKPPRLPFPAGVDARVARAVERTAWWVDRCLEDLGDLQRAAAEEADLAAAEAAAEAAADGAAAAPKTTTAEGLRAIARSEQDYAIPEPFEEARGRLVGGGGDGGGGGKGADPAATTATTTTRLPLQYFAPVVGCDSPAARVVSSREAARRDAPLIAGYALCGFGAGEPASSRPVLLRAALSALPAEKPKLVSGLDAGPLEVLDAVAAGVDIFDCSWPTLSTAAGYALSFPVTPEEEAAGVFDDDGEEEENRAGPAAAAVDAPWAAAAAAAAAAAQGPVASAEALAASAAAEAAGGPTRGRRLPDGARINLWAPGFRLDRRPLAPGCGCFACSGGGGGGGVDGASPPATTTTKFPPPSRAYVHHLLAVDEMVAEVLLDLHNAHRWLRFFSEVRKAVARGQLSEYRAWLSEWIARRSYDSGAQGMSPSLRLHGAPLSGKASKTTTKEDDE